MIVEIDEVVVHEGDWQLALKGDKEAVRRIQDDIDGIEIYMHNIMASGEIVTLRQLECAGVVEGAQIKVGPYRIKPAQINEDR